MRDAAAAGELFFLYYWLSAPHAPAIPDPRDIGWFEGETDVSFPGRPESSMLESAYGVDRAVGKLLDILPANTIVVHLSDNGYLWGEHGVTDKRYAYNESVRIPVVLASLDGTHAPAAGADDLVLNVDLRPTLTWAAGVRMLTRAEGLDWGGHGYVPRGRFALEMRGGPCRISSCTAASANPVGRTRGTLRARNSCSTTRPTPCKRRT